MEPKPSHLGPSFAVQFGDASVANAYVARPPYPEELFELLLRYVSDPHRNVLDLGCGLGEIARRLAPSVERVDAVDPSLPMLNRGRSLPGGDHRAIHWRNTTAEGFEYPFVYSLVVAAESFHWMDWPVVMEKVAASLSEHGSLALVVGRGEDRAPWLDALLPIIKTCSTNTGFRPYDLVAELQTRSLFDLSELLETRTVVHRQEVERFVESLHSRNGLSRDRMGPRLATSFDRRIREVLLPYAESGILEIPVTVRVAIGYPRAA